MGIQFRFDKKSEYYTDPKVRKIRIIANTIDAIGLILIIGSLLLFWNKFPELKTDIGFEFFLQIPIPFIILGCLLLSIGSIIKKVAMVKAGIQAFKSDDNPFFKEKERITNEINDVKSQFDEMKNNFNNSDNNENKE